MEPNRNSLVSKIIETKTGYSIESVKYEDNNEYILNSKEEKELQTSFKYFNVFWFDPNNTKDYDYFRNSFKNVKFYKGTDIDQVINFFNKEFTLEEWIVVLPGSKCQDLILKLNEKEIIKAFFIFCYKPELYEELPKKYEKIKGITKDPFILAKKILEFNKDYLTPNFNYEESKKIKFDFELNLDGLESQSKYALQSLLREKNELLKSIKKDGNKYNIFCIKTLNYLKDEKKCFEDFEESIKDEKVVFYSYVDSVKFEEKNKLKKIIKFTQNMTMISLYFSSYDYLFNLMTYKEIKKMLSKEVTPKSYIELYNKSVYKISEDLYEKLMKNQSILSEVNSLKKLQMFSILFTYFGLARHRTKDFIEFYQIINFYRDIDFCLKFLIFYIYLVFNNGKNKFVNDLYCAFNLSDYRTCRIFLGYANDKLKEKKMSLSPEEQKMLDDSLTVKDFIIIGDAEFYKKIKTIEKKIPIKSIEYLTIDRISDYVKKKNLLDSKNFENNCLVTYFYYIIINIQDFQKYYSKICLLEAELGISFYIIIFIEKENEILFNKNIIKINFIPIIVVYSLEDIIIYLTKKIKFNVIEDIKEILENDPDFIDFHKQKISKINFNENNNEDYQDGCFELAETFDLNLIKNKIIRRHSDCMIDISAICYNLYLTYSERNALNVFFKFASLYYGFSIDPESINLEVSVMKKILYMYCREEFEREKSLYNIFNSDLRTRNPAKIYRYLDLIALINKLIDNGELANYKGKVFRATKLDEQMILKLEPGSYMINTTFWSTSKDFDVAERFLKNQKWRNAFITCETIKNNIDIDYENLNYFGEKEVLFLPFNEFRVEKIIIEKKYDRKIFIIELTELGTQNAVGLQNMQIININDIDYMNFNDKIKEKKEQEKKENAKNNDKKIDNDKDKNIMKEKNKIKLDDNIKPKLGDNIIQRFRSAFQFSKEDYNDDYVRGLLSKANQDFNMAMLIHVETENRKKEINRQNVKDEKKLNLMVQEFRDFYKLSSDDYSDDVIKKTLIKNEGDFDHTFEELMSFIQ